ncbi:MAG: HEAT repeat domain-containing protein [Anaerolineae bacterium]|nr:HEAT repeat domain-containing protein [Anaerolineae bacterium]
MTTNDRMIAFHIARLKDKNAQVRIKSIEELVLLGATNAYTLLEDLFYNDPDLSVRQAAQQAGRQLYLKIQEEKTKAPGEGGSS